MTAGNCKLQTLRQYYRLPERGAHTALGDVETVADLFATVQRRIAEQRGLLTWEQLVGCAGEEWYPSRIAFGKHKLRGHFQRRDQLRDIIRYRRKFLEMLERHGANGAAQVKEEYRQASAWSGDILSPLRAFRRGAHFSGTAGRSGVRRFARVGVAFRAVVETAAGSTRLHEGECRLTERSPEFFDETVSRHLVSLAKELATLQNEAETLAGEIAELTGGPGFEVKGADRPS